jgi:hypothetical protein
MLVAELTELLRFHPVRMGFLVFGDLVVPLLAVLASERYLNPHDFRLPNEFSRDSSKIRPNENNLIFHTKK